MVKKIKKKTVAKKVKKIKKSAVKKKSTKPAVKKQKKAASKPLKGLTVIGLITHYFPHVNAGVIKLKKPLSAGDSIYIKGHTSDFKQKVESMQIDHASVAAAKTGDEIGILVGQRVRIGDIVYKI